MNTLAEFEKNDIAHRITHQGVHVWPLIKNYLPLFAEIGKEVVKKEDRGTINILLKGLLRDAFWCVQIFRSTIWVFTNSERRYELNGKHFDRVTSGLLRFFPSYVLFENPIPKGQSPRKKLQKGEYWVGLSWLFLLQKAIMACMGRLQIKNLHLLDQELGVHKTKIQSLVKRYHAEYLLYRFLFHFRKPKAVFVVCYYTKYGLIRACKKRGIPVFELQHGLVSPGHRAYYFSRDFDSDYFPDYFLSYGAYSSEVVSQGHVVPKSHTLDYGYTFLDEVAGRLSMSQELKAIKNRFKKVVCITGQLPVTDVPLLEMISEVHSLFPEMCFIYKPRFEDSTAISPTSGNFIQHFELNTYELLKYCDYHLTVYSTCAMECLALGTPNIAVDIKGYYTQFLKPMLNDNPFNFTVSDIQGLIQILKKLEKEAFDPNVVKESIRPIFSEMISSEAFFEFFDEVVK
jgi:hypothetical protein